MQGHEAVVVHCNTAEQKQIYMHNCELKHNRAERKKIPEQRTEWVSPDAQFTACRVSQRTRANETG